MPLCLRPYVLLSHFAPPPPCVMSFMNGPLVFPERGKKLFCLKCYFSTFSAQETLDSGFKCPSKPEKQEAFDTSDPHPKYPDPADCAKFYICLNGVSPRAQGCELGLVFNTLTLSCDSPENVPEW